MQTAPPNSTVMLAWGPRYFAANIAQDIHGEFQDIRLVDHKADFRQIASEGMLLTPDYTRFNQPPQWWGEQLGMPIYTSSNTPGLITINTTAEIVPDAPSGMTVADASLTCADNGLLLNLTWWADQTPDRDYSVFVHALSGDDPTPIAQADSFAPVAGWRPTTSWLPDEQIDDSYWIEVDPTQVDHVRYGLFWQPEANQFEHVLEQEITVECDGESA